MAEEKKRAISQINVDLSCDLQCDKCEKFFSCTRPEKMDMYLRARMKLARERISKIKKKIIVVGGKGGVGKTLLAVNLATALAMKGRKVTVLDQNFDGPCVHKMFGLEGKRLSVSDAGIEPVTAILGIQVISMGLVLEEDEVLTWFHDLRRNALEEFLCGVNYGERDYLITDLPAGTSSDTQNILQFVPEADGAVVITIPTDVSQGVAHKAVVACQKANIRVLGIVENMAGLICPYCGKYSEPYLRGGADKLAQTLGLPILGRIPLDREISRCSDAGTPFVYANPELPASKEMMKIADQVEQMVGWSG